MGFIYIVTDDDKIRSPDKPKRWKVGMTEGRDVFKRVNSFKTYSPSSYLCFCYEVEDAKLTEKQLHDHLDSLNIRVEGEWFTSPSISALLDIVFKFVHEAERTTSVAPVLKSEIEPIIKVEISKPVEEQLPSTIAYSNIKLTIPRTNSWNNTDALDPDLDPKTKTPKEIKIYLNTVSYYLEAIHPMLMLYHNSKRCTLGILGYKRKSTFFPEFFSFDIPRGYQSHWYRRKESEEPPKVSWFTKIPLKRYIINIIGQTIKDPRYTLSSDGDFKRMSQYELNKYLKDFFFNIQSQVSKRQLKQERMLDALYHRQITLTETFVSCINTEHDIDLDSNSVPDPTKVYAHVTGNAYTNYLHTFLEACDYIDRYKDFCNNRGTHWQKESIDVTMLSKTMWLVRGITSTSKSKAPIIDKTTLVRGEWKRQNDDYYATIFSENQIMVADISSEEVRTMLRQPELHFFVSEPCLDAEITN